MNGIETEDGLVFRVFSLLRDWGGDWMLRGAGQGYLAYRLGGGGMVDNQEVLDLFTIDCE
jgi:hypothetical protein